MEHHIIKIVNINQTTQRILKWLHPSRNISIHSVTKEYEPNDVDTYWGGHTVNSTPFQSAEEALKYLEWRTEEYPLFHEHMGLWGQHDQEIILDYGCGPGNDMVGFLAHTAAKKGIGMDISTKALELAAQRLALHRFDLERIALIHLSDSTPRIPLDDNSVDYIYCEGVLHHVSYPLEILSEFHRILNPGKKASIMVYNRNSVYFHLEVAYRQMIVHNLFAGMTPDEAAPKTVDGVDCPIAHFYPPQEFAALCREAGFEFIEMYAYFARCEFDLLKEFGETALADERLPVEQRQFLDRLTYDDRGYPFCEGKHAGYGGTYQLTKIV